MEDGIQVIIEYPQIALYLRYSSTIQATPCRLSAHYVGDANMSNGRKSDQGIRVMPAVSYRQPENSY